MRVSRLVLLAVVGFGWPVAAMAAETAPQVNVAHAILIDAETGTVLFEKGADALVDPASTSKIMTAEIVFEMLKDGKLKPDQLFHISQTAWRQGGAPSRGTTMFAKPNSDVAVNDLLQGLIVDSANDAAIALAEGISGSQGAFATLMTRRARELGLDHLTFTDAWGDASPDQKVTPREMAVLAQHQIATFPDLYKMYAQRDFVWNKIKQPNRNPLLGFDIGADGLKTGNIGDSGYSIVGSAVQGDQRLILALYDSKSAKERSEEARKILQWGFRAFARRKLFAAGETVAYADVDGGASGSVGLVSDRDIAVLVQRDSGEKLVAKIVYQGPLPAPVAAGQQVAMLKLYRGDAEILTAPLRTASTVDIGSLPKRALDVGVGYLASLFRKYVLHS
jgi:serine-type D-Ala-D-Ala carboxypeptidase (penicillin-binding protein 5/6)